MPVLARTCLKAHPLRLPRGDMVFQQWLQSKQIAGQLERRRAVEHFQHNRQHEQAAQMSRALERKAYEILEKGWNGAFTVPDARRVRK